MVEINESISRIGRLSTQKKSISSSALNATVLPEPERPVMITMVGFNFLNNDTRCRIHDSCKRESY
jgi:hypothetical protein